MLVRQIGQGFTEVTHKQRHSREEGSSFSPSADRMAKALRQVPAWGVKGHAEPVWLAQL